MNTHTLYYVLYCKGISNVIEAMLHTACSKMGHSQKAQIHARMHAHIHVYIYICVCVCMGIYIYVYTCVRACVRVFGPLRMAHFQKCDERVKKKTPFQNKC